MNSSLHSSGAGSIKSTKLHLPLEQLTAMLRREGFSIKPDDYIELLKVVEKFGSEDIAALKTKLCPLIATSEIEQSKFYHVFDEYVRINLQPGDDVNGEIPDKPLWKKILPWLIPFTALLTAMLFLASNAPVIEPNFSITIRDAAGNSYSGAIPGDSLLVDASSSFANQKNPDTQAVSIRWNFGKGWSNFNQLNAGILVKEEGIVPIVLEIASGKNRKSVRTDTQFVKVCASVPMSIVADGEEAPALGGSLRLRPTYRGKNQNLAGAWFVNGENKERGNSFQLSFNSPGNYSVKFVPGENKTDSFCYPPIETNFTIADTSYAAQLSVLPSGNSIAKTSTQYKFNQWWLLALSALVVASLAIIIARHRKARKKLLAVAAMPTDINKGSGKKLDPPYEVPFENRDLQYVVRDREMNLFFRSMRSKTEDDFQALNVPKTIKSVIQSGGVPALVFTNKLKYQEYLLLVDQSNVKSQQLKLFEYLCKVLADENVTIEKFYYNNFNLFKNDQYPNGISLQRLCELYKTHTLVIFGNAWQLLYPAYPVLDKEIFSVLQEWEYKAILTPVAYKDWGLKETLLKKSLVLLPADPEGQVRLMQAIKERQIQHDKYLSSFESFYEPSAYDLYSIKDIKEYLGDETLFQWLCATCVYPRLRWEIVIEMGKLICGRYGHETKFNYANLLKLVRIPWMAEGSFPEKTRLELMKQLTVENEVAAREKILEMLRYAGIYFGDQHFFSEEKKMQQLTNEFVLFASNKEKYARYRHSEQAFKNRWQQQKIYDGPLRVYLEKSGEGQWHTPIEQDGQNPGLREYFNTGEKKAIRRVNKAYNLFYGALAILLLTLGIVNKNRILNSSFAQNIRLSVADSSSKKLIYLILSVDSCVGNINSYLAGARGRLDLNESSIDLAFDNSGFAPLNLTTAQLNLPSNSFTLQADSNVNIRLTNLPLAYDTVRLLLSGICSTPATKSPLYIRYNNNNSLPLVNQIIQSLSGQYQISAEFSSFDGASRLVYYNREKENEYFGLAKFIGQQTGITLGTQYIEENRTPPAVPIVLLDFASLDCNPVGTGNLPPALNEIWGAAGNNRLININLQRGIIWYSTGSNSTYGTYRIAEVCRYSSGTYKIITQANNAYKAFFIRNIQSQSLELSVCQNLLSTKQAVDELGETACDSYNRMSPYYETNDQYIYLPVNNGPLATQEIKKLMEIERQMNSPSNLNVQTAKEDQVALITIFENREYVDRSNADAIDRYFDNYKINHSYTRGSLMNQQGDNPFARNYITVMIDKVAVDPCSITFQSIADAIKQADKVCRLDISNKKLESLPKELAEFKSLQYIDVRNNFLSARDSISLYRLFPNARILFYPQQKTPEPPVSWTFLRRIDIDRKRQIDKDAEAFLKTVAAEMRQNYDARLKLVAYYDSQRDDKKNAELLLGEFQNLLVSRYDFKAFSNRIETEINPIRKANNPVKTNFIGSPQQKAPGRNTDYIEIYGLNINLNTGTKK